MKRKVLHCRNERARLPITGTIAFGLLLDRLNAPAAVWGIMGTLAFILWIALLYDLYWGSQQVDIFKKETKK